ncbi:MAG: DsrE family protein [Spirochaetales bacterium]|nr:DsrE family protein [Spirochaetales bacterium]
MKKLVLAIFVLCLCVSMYAGDDKPEDDKLVILWTSGDREVALKMAFMYTLNSRRYGWWDDITFVVWGPSAKLLSEDTELQQSIKQMKEMGVTLKACKMCSDQYGVSSKLSALGIEVKYMGELTDYIKNGRNILTF